MVTFYMAFCHQPGPSPYAFCCSAILLQICPFVFNHFHDAPPATPFASIFCIVARGGIPCSKNTPEKNDLDFKSSLPYILPSSVSSNSFVCHSYENCPAYT